MPQRVLLSKMGREDVSFLLLLWGMPEVMRYADEFPAYRGWTKSGPAEAAWERYVSRRADLGPGYTQLILKLEDGTRIGESFFAPLPEGYTFGPWSKPAGMLSLMGDIKLLPEYWGRGYGTELKRALVDHLFRHTDCDVVQGTPNVDNVASIRMQEAAGAVRVSEREYEFPEHMRHYTAPVRSYVYHVRRADWERRQRSGER